MKVYYTYVCMCECLESIKDIENVKHIVNIKIYIGLFCLLEIYFFINIQIYTINLSLFSNVCIFVLIEISCQYVNVKQQQRRCKQKK